MRERVWTVVFCFGLCLTVPGVFASCVDAILAGFARGTGGAPRSVARDVQPDRRGAPAPARVAHTAVRYPGKPSESVWWCFLRALCREKREEQHVGCTGLRRKEGTLASGVMRWESPKGFGHLRETRRRS